MAVGSLFTFDIYKVSWRPCINPSDCLYRPDSRHAPMSMTGVR